MRRIREKTRPGDLIQKGVAASIAGAVLLVIGIGSTPVLMVIGYVVIAIGSIVLSTGIVAKGVEIGIKAARE